jgi:hypothetical protein
MFGVLRSLSEGLAKTRKNLADKIGTLVLVKRSMKRFSMSWKKRLSRPM